MTRVFRRFVAILMVAALVAPATAAVCAAGETCTTAQPADHSCCETPVLADCECGDTAAATEDSAEPARRHGDEARPAAVTADVSLVVPPPARCHAASINLTLPRDTGGRLSLLSVLIV